MSKRKTKKAVEDFRDWLANYDHRQASELMGIVGRMLASLPGGDEFEDLGYDPYDSVSWHEFKLIHDVYMAIEDSSDVEMAAEILFASDDDDDYEENPTEYEILYIDRGRVRSADGRTYPSRPDAEEALDVLREHDPDPTYAIVRAGEEHPRAR